MAKKIERVEVRQGYDLWAETYDTTPNPVVAMDGRHTIARLAPQAGELILDAGCGTGRNLRSLLEARSIPVGMDFSFGMLKVAERRYPQVAFAQADLQQNFPFRESSFDAVLCALIGEHLSDLRKVYQETFSVLKAGGRFVFSVYHPALAAAGKEANFERDGVEYRFGAYQHTVEDYVKLLDEAGFQQIRKHEFSGDEELAAQVPSAVKYLNFPVLLILEGKKAE
jgi:malonyl-CoA O-methyltransferase